MTLYLYAKTPTKETYIYMKRELFEISDYDAFAIAYCHTITLEQLLWHSKFAVAHLLLWRI